MPLPSLPLQHHAGPGAARSARRVVGLAGSALALLLLSAACKWRGDVRPASSDIEPPPPFVGTPDSCRASEVRFALGRRITAPLLEELRQRTGARAARTALPGDPPPGTPDASQLVIDIESTGRIVGARCG